MIKMTTEPIGEIFETLNANETFAFAFIHDNRRSETYYEDLTEFIIDGVKEVCPDEAIILADYTDLDTDTYGDHVTCYFWGKSTCSFVFEGEEGLDKHGIEIHHFRDSLGEKWETLSKDDRDKLNDCASVYDVEEKGDEKGYEY